MSRWGLETSPRFEKAARKLDPQVLRRVKAYLDEVCELDDPRSRDKGLTGQLAGYWRYRIGDCRVLVEAPMMIWSSSRSLSGTDPASTDPHEVEVADRPGGNGSSP